MRVGPTKRTAGVEETHVDGVHFRAVLRVHRGGLWEAEAFGDDGNYEKRSGVEDTRNDAHRAAARWASEVSLQWAEAATRKRHPERFTATTASTALVKKTDAAPSLMARFWALFAALFTRKPRS